MKYEKPYLLQIIIICSLAIILSSCATMQSIPSSKRTKVYNADYLATFKAVASYCNDNSFAITMADKDLGIVNTDFKENDGTAKFFFGNYRAKLNFAIRNLSETTTQVLINASVERQGAFGSWTQTTMTENQATELYQNIFSGIEKYLNDSKPNPKSGNENDTTSVNSTSEETSFSLKLHSDEPETILNGRISLTYISAFGGKSLLSGKGMWGFSINKFGAFSGSSIKISKNDTFYMQTDEQTIYEIIVIQEIYNVVTLNFTKI